MDLKSLTNKMISSFISIVIVISQLHANESDENKSKYTLIKQDFLNPDLKNMKLPPKTEDYSEPPEFKGKMKMPLCLGILTIMATTAASMYSTSDTEEENK